MTSRPPPASVVDRGESSRVWFPLDTGRSLLHKVYANCRAEYRVAVILVIPLIRTFGEFQRAASGPPRRGSQCLKWRTASDQHRRAGLLRDLQDLASRIEPRLAKAVTPASSRTWTAVGNG